jgi:hypothetical protein
MEDMVTVMAGDHSTTIITTTAIMVEAASHKNPIMPGGQEVQTTSLLPIQAPHNPRILLRAQETGGITVAIPTGVVHLLQEAEVMETVAQEEVLPEAAVQAAAADLPPAAIAIVVHQAVAEVQEGVNFSTGKQNETSFSYLF